MKWVWFFGLSSLALLLGLGFYLAPLQPPLVALQFSFSQQALEATTALWGPQGVVLFRSHLYPDFGLMVCYALYGVCTVRFTRLFRMRHVPPLVGYSLMPLAAIADATENCLHLALTAPGASLPEAWYLAAGLAACAKFGLIALFLGIALARAASLARRT